MADEADRISQLFTRFRDLAGGDNLAAAALVLASALAETKNAEPDARCLTIKAVASRLGVSEGTVRNLIDCGRLSASRVGAGRGTFRVEPDELRKFQKRSAGTIR
jgi:excisionase family DNA binding protein